MDELIADFLCVRWIEVQEALSFVEGRQQDEVQRGERRQDKDQPQAQMATGSIGTSACIQRG